MHPYQAAIHFLLRHLAQHADRVTSQEAKHLLAAVEAHDRANTPPSEPAPAPEIAPAIEQTAQATISHLSEATGQGVVSQE